MNGKYTIAHLLLAVVIVGVRMSWFAALRTADTWYSIPSLKYVRPETPKQYLDPEFGPTDVEIFHEHGLRESFADGQDLYQTGHRRGWMSAVYRFIDFNNWRAFEHELGEYQSLSGLESLTNDHYTNAELAGYRQCYDVIKNALQYTSEDKLRSRLLQSRNFLRRAVVPITLTCALLIVLIYARKRLKFAT